MNDLQNSRMDNGWVKIHRTLLENPFWKNEVFTRGQAWIDLLLLANFEKSYCYKRGVKIEVEKGQIVKSEVELSDRWKWSRTKLRKFLEELEKEQQIKQQKTNVTLIITVLCLDVLEEKEQQKEQQQTELPGSKLQQQQ